MANSKFEYVRDFETEDKCLKQTWIVVRVDGKGFHSFADKHDFQKPNDLRALNLMNRAAKSVMETYTDIAISFGHSDEYSFVLRKQTEIYNRRASKILSHICSNFTSAFVFHWPTYFGDQKLLFPPIFDGRIILYPSDKCLRDYMSWRQVDAHINNLYNTCFWNLVLKKNLSNTEAQNRLKGTFSSDKNELLFSEFGINYNNELDICKKGTTVVRKGSKLETFNIDIIKDQFWNDHQHILATEQSMEMSSQTSRAKLKEIPEQTLPPTDGCTQTNGSVALLRNIPDTHMQTQTTPSDNHIQTQTIISENHIETQTIPPENHIQTQTKSYDEHKETQT